MAQIKDIYVYMDWQESDSPIQMGVLHSEVLRGKEVFSFENNTDWLTYKQFRALDPDLAQFSGKQYLPADKSNFGIFLDSSPDRWGRMLMRRREVINARLENRPSRTLTEADYLLGVYDGNRMGALRFKLSPDDEFMDNNKAMATPPWTSIRDLEYASLQLEKENLKDDAEYAKWLNMLIAPGSSLGGARPKANILDNNGALWIAKFPSGHDTKDMGAWEAVTAEMARKCGIEMAESRAQKFSNRQHTFLTKRFDRINGKRIHFASAMTLLGYTDGTNSAEGVSYLELAEWIGRNCNNVSQNLEQLWRRIVFNIAVSNCDDHLRNHGFLLTPKGWTLSPAYDINPDEHGMGLKLNIPEDDNSLDFELALSVAAYFGLDNATSNEIINQTKKVVSNWQQLATQYGISRSEQEDNTSAFRY
ncbi:HipA domain-containing protein [Bacteroides nordii]|uniref:type II toxin-antitoxin system HipA family toxin n=1 Tax=Bacteroides nordii TaxID=291645 RepID=UPI002A7EC596|nr:HipA domain-containing protein [Bacteroides nordii]